MTDLSRRILAGTIAAAIFLCLVPAVIFADDGDWEYLYTKDGIDVFRKSIPGTPAHAFKGFGFVDARLEVIGTVLRDIENYPRWVARCDKALLLRDIDYNTKIFYGVVDTPLPFKDRDMVMENDTVYHVEKGTAEIVFRLSDQELVPPNDKYLRVPELSGEYLLEYFGRDKTRVTFTYRGCPGGNVPVRIVDWIESKKYPYINIMGIREMVRKQRYIDAGHQSPDRELIESAAGDINQLGQIFKNRIGDYLVDRQILDVIFESPMIHDMIRLIYEQKTSFESIQQAVMGVFFEFAANPAVPPLMKDKSVDELLSIDRIMQEKWVLTLVAEHQQLIEPFLAASNRTMEQIFYKIMSSEKTVKILIKDEDLARTILNNESVRSRLWQDEAFKKELLDKIGSFDSIGDVEKIIADRVRSYDQI